MKNIAIESTTPKTILSGYKTAKRLNAVLPESKIVYDVDKHLYTLHLPTGESVPLIGLYNINDEVTTEYVGKTIKFGVIGARHLSDIHFTPWDYVVCEEPETYTSDDLNYVYKMANFGHCTLAFMKIILTLCRQCYAHYEGIKAEDGKGLDKRVESVAINQ